METWPAQLQDKANVASFSAEFGDTTVRSDMDVGPAKIRSRYTDAVDMYTISIDLDFDEYSYLEDFYKTTLGNGVLTFGFVNPLTEVLEEFRFMAPPNITPMGGRIFKVNMKWVRLP